MFRFAKLIIICPDRYFLKIFLVCIWIRPVRFSIRFQILKTTETLSKRISSKIHFGYMPQKNKTGVSSPKKRIPNGDPKWAPVTGIRNGNPKRLALLGRNLGFWNGSPTQQFQIARATWTHDPIGPLDQWTVRPLTQKYCRPASKITKKQSRS